MAYIQSRKYIDYTGCRVRLVTPVETRIGTFTMGHEFIVMGPNSSCEPEFFSWDLIDGAQRVAYDIRSIAFEVIDEEHEEGFLSFGAADGTSRRERNAIAYLACLVGDDGGQKIDSLEGWCHRVWRKMAQIEEHNEYLVQAQSEG